MRGFEVGLHLTLRVTLCLLLEVLTLSMPAVSQIRTGELRIRVADTNGTGLKAQITVTSQANEYKTLASTDDAGEARVQTVPYGVYIVEASKTGFAPASVSLEVHSALPVETTLRLHLTQVVTAVKVQTSETLVDPDRPSSVMQVGTQAIHEKVLSLPGRSVQDLVATQPGWLYEGNAVLHPRGSEYQTQFVIDGIPLTDNRSPSFGPEIESNDLGSMSVYTAGFPAEYGRKLGGIVELNTKLTPDEGLHGQLDLSGGSYNTAAAYGQVQQVWKKNTFGATAEGSRSSHYLNPVVPENYANDGTTGDFSARYEREFTLNDRLSMSVRHELSRFEIPNELVQQQAGQLQTGDNFEIIGSANYQHIFSADTLGTLAGMVRDNSNDLFSNESSTPINATQHNDFREGYFKAALTRHYAHQEWKAGFEVDTTLLHEDFNYLITDPTQFDDDTPGSLSFIASRPNLEQAAFVEDLVRLGQWTISAGLRYDHYQLILNENAFSPRLALSRYFPATKTVLHASYDRIFQTPSFENILISSSPQIDALSPDFLRLPVQPSRGNYFEGGATQALADRLRLDVNIYRRDVRNYADDDQLLNTGVSYPIAFDKAIIYGAEGKIEVVRLGQLTGYASYSYMVGNAWYPVTGGLFLGDDADAAVTQLTGHFPDSQDQRNTLSARFRYQAVPRVWLASGASFGSGLPFEFEGTEEDALAQYGQQVIDRINFDRGRIKPLLSVNASLGVDVYKGERVRVLFQADGDNLNNRLNVIDFGGLFSGNAIAPGRSFGLHLHTSF